MGQNSRGEVKTIDRSLDSTLDSVDDAENLALGLAREAGFRDEELQKIGMAVRESVVNAIVHGNRYSADKKVRVTLVKNGSRFTVRVADQGEGFDPDALPDPLAQENLLRQSGRGIFLIRAFMDEFQVRRLEPHGTEITMVKYVVENE
jgi:serine/threonine-protein kinase RsbW